MKKLISLILCTAMICSCFTVFAQENTNIAQNEIPLAQTESEGLQKLGILKGTENGLELERGVTRAEALTFIWRTTGTAFNDIGYVTPSFTDIEGHWAYDTIEKFYHAGYIDGTSEKYFEPERIVTCKEFVKILLSVMGYKDVTIENAYDKGIETGLLNDNFTKSTVHNNYLLTRSDTVRLCFNALCAKTPSDEMLYKTLIKNGELEERDFDGILYVENSVEKAESFADKLKSQMPTEKNYMFSPFSIKMALAMAANGADGDTKKEILNAVGIDDLDAYNTASKEMIEKYLKTDILKLNIANSIWINKDQSIQNFSDSYKKTISEFFGGEANVTDNQKAVNEINSWVNEKTNEKIPTIIDNANFFVALVNAIYFKGAWENEFSEAATAKSEFTDRNGKKSYIDFMHQKHRMNYFGNDSIQIVELPYKNRVDNFSESGEYIGTDKYDDIDVSMFVIMGNDSLSEIQSILEAEKLTNTYVDLSIPKFKIEYNVNLNDMLKSIGINTAFNMTAEFEPMFNTGSMLVSDVLHKTYIEVDEKETEAAAAVIVMAGTGMAPESVVFNANKPFTFVIRDNTNGEILFVGEYAFAE